MPHTFRIGARRDRLAGDNLWAFSVLDVNEHCRPVFSTYSRRLDRFYQPDRLEKQAVGIVTTDPVRPL